MALRLKRNAPSGEADEASPDCATRFGFRASPYRIVKQQMMFLPLHISVGSPLPAPCSLLSARAETPPPSSDTAAKGDPFS